MVLTSAEAGLLVALGLSLPPQLFVALPTQCLLLGPHARLRNTSCM